MMKPDRRRFLQGALAAFLAGILPCWTPAGSARAEEATLMRASLTLDEPGERSGLFLSASFEFDMPQPLLEALHRGIPLYFVHEFRLTKDRWYWFDKEKISRSFLTRLSFDPLTQRYRLSYDGLSYSFDKLEQVLPFVKTVRRWRVGPADAIKSADGYHAEVRFYLDADKLPKPMQVVNTGRNDWTVASDWSDVPITPDVVVSQ